MKHTVNDGVRMVGQLLLHHPTEGYWAHTVEGDLASACRPDASCWCLAGACTVVAKAIRLSEDLLKRAVIARIEPLNGGTDYPTDALIHLWEGPHTTDQSRQAIARRLAQVVET